MWQDRRDMTPQQPEWVSAEWVSEELRDLDGPVNNALPAALPDDERAGFDSGAGRSHELEHTRVKEVQDLQGKLAFL